MSRFSSLPIAYSNFRVLGMYVCSTTLCVQKAQNLSVNTVSPNNRQQVALAYMLPTVKSI